MAGTLTKVFILSKTNLFVDGIEHILNTSERHHLVSRIEPGSYSWHKLSNTQADILLIHINALDHYSADFIGKIQNHSPDISVLVFGHTIDHNSMLALIRAGARGYLYEDMDGEDLLRAMDEVSAGNLWLERDLLNNLAQNALEMETIIEDTIRQRLDELGNVFSQREKDVLQLILEGLTTKEIANHMHLSEQSIKLYLGRLFRKLKVNNRGQLILSVFQRVCPVSNLLRLIQKSLDKRRIAKGAPPLIPDPLAIQPDKPSENTVKKKGSLSSNLLGTSIA